MSQHICQCITNTTNKLLTGNLANTVIWSMWLNETPPVTYLSSRVVCHMRPECFSSLLSLRYNNLSSDKRWLKMFILTIYPTPNWHQRIKMRVSVFLLTLLLTFIEYWLNIIFPKDAHGVKILKLSEFNVLIFLPFSCIWTAYQYL